MRIQSQLLGLASIKPYFVVAPTTNTKARALRNTIFVAQTDVVQGPLYEEGSVTCLGCMEAPLLATSQLKSSN